MISIVSKLMPYKWLIAAGLAVALICGLYAKGRSDGKHAERARWVKRMEQVQERINALQARSDSLVILRRRLAEEEIAKQQQHTVAVFKEIDEHRREFDRVPVPSSAVEIYNKSVRGR